jgi:hypothetical protein
MIARKPPPTPASSELAGLSGVIFRINPSYSPVGGFLIYGMCLLAGFSIGSFHIVRPTALQNAGMEPDAELV